MSHTLEETIVLAVKTAILREHPIGSYYLTEGTENPKDFIGGQSLLDYAPMAECVCMGAHCLEWGCANG